jgi:hypothetical protein
MKLTIAAVTIARLLAAFLLAFVVATQAPAQPCNPIVDGTYCASQMPRSSSATSESLSSAQIRSLGNDLTSRNDPPATFGAITFGGGGRCIGGLFRGSCS